MDDDKRLVRSSSDKIIGGVCAGMAHYFGFKVSTVRLFWIIALLIGSAGFWIYLILWLVLPQRN